MIVRRVHAREDWFGGLFLERFLGGASSFPTFLDLRKVDIKVKGIATRCCMSSSS